VKQIVERLLGQKHRANNGRARDRLGHHHRLLVVARSLTLECKRLTIV
jgi:hypothetical protein